MKKVIVILIVCFLSFSCSNNTEHLKTTNNSRYLIIDEVEFKIVTGSDGHEYFTHYWSHGATFEHIVDCKFCAKRKNGN